MHSLSHLRLAFRSLGWALPILLLVGSVAHSSLGIDQAKKKKPTNGASAKEGQQLFGKFCVACHGANGVGDEGPNLHKLALTDAEISETIKKGRKGEMPTFVGKIKDPQIKSIIAYLRTLK